MAEKNKQQSNQPNRSELLGQLKEAIVQENQELWRWLLRDFMSNFDDKAGIADIVNLADEVAGTNPNAATDLITNGAFRKYIRVIISEGGYTVLKRSNDDETLRERAAQTLLSLSAGNQLAPKKAIFAAWVAALNLDPESAAGKVAADQAFSLGEKIDSSLIPAMVRSLIEIHTDPVIISEAVELWKKRYPTMSLQTQIEEIPKLSWEIAKKGQTIDLSNEWEKAASALGDQASRIYVFNEAEKVLLHPYTPEPLSKTAARFWENVIDSYCPQDPDTAIEKAEHTQTHLNHASNEDLENTPLKDMVARKLLGLSVTGNKQASCRAIFAAAGYKGTNENIISEIREHLRGITPEQGFNPDQVIGATEKLTQFNHDHKPDSGPAPSL